MSKIKRKGVLDDTVKKVHSKINPYCNIHYSSAFCCPVKNKTPYFSVFYNFCPHCVFLIFNVDQKTSSS